MATFVFVWLSYAATTIPYAPSPMYLRFENLGPTLKVWLFIKTDSPPQLYIEDGAEWCVVCEAEEDVGFLIDISSV